MTVVEEQKRTDIFAFTWSIHNFSYCALKENEFLDSPKFVAELLGDATWYLRLYPRGEIDAPGFLSYYLHTVGPTGVTVNCALSIRASSGIFFELGEHKFDTSVDFAFGCKQFVSLEKLKEPNSFLNNNTLTCRCRMWRNDTNISVSVDYYAYTKLKVSKINYVWTIKEVIDSNNVNRIINTKFNQSNKIETFSREILAFNISLLYGGTLGDDTIHVRIEKTKETKTLFLMCLINLLDADGRIAHSVREECLFENSNETQIWKFPFISKLKLLSQEKLYLTSGNLTVKCEISASTGTVISEIERFDYGGTHTGDLQLKNSNHKQVSNLSNLWNENMKRCYQEGKFSDVTIHLPNKKFPVHKAILCAQSEVFSVMFERDMKENRTGVVEIEDLEDDTISKMLMYLYTNTVEDLDFSMACKLYFAADKYRIMALRMKCSTYLIYSLDTSNVCDVLDLADTHHDHELKHIARGFIFDHDQEIINSEDWKKLMEAKPKLTNETMQLLICEKFHGYPKP